MFELAQHIESLLLRNDCVIVPYLGGFVTCYRPARHVEEEHLFLPPARNVSFNARLTVNDGLLAQSYMLANDISFPDAQKMVEQDVAHVKEVLQQEGEFTFDGIGTLLMRIDGHYDFVPLEAGVVSPGLYGLDAVEAVPLQGARRSRYRRPALLKRLPRKAKLRTRARATRKRAGRIAVQAAMVGIVAFLLYFAWATPAYLSSGQQATQANMAGNLLFDTPSAVPATVPGTPTPPSGGATAETDGTGGLPGTPGQPAEAANQPTGTDGTPSPATGETDTPAIPASGDGYTLVLASAVSLQNAERYVRDLKQRGYEEAAVLQRKYMTRVICGRYATEKEAYNALNRLNDKSEFADAWVLALN